MGQNISSDQAKLVADHLNKQEELIKQLQAVVAQQSRALDNLHHVTVDESKERDYDGYNSGDEEFNRLIRVSVDSESRKDREPHVDHHELQKKDNDVFDPEHAEKNFMAIKPWLGRLFAPTGYVKDPKWDEQPALKLQLEHVYGYRARLTRNNVYNIEGDRVVYFAAAVGIVHNFANNTQSFFQGHDDDIICLDYHADKKLVVTGQMGKQPKICVWNVDTQAQVAVFQGYHRRAVLAVSFSADGTKVASVGADDNYSVAVYDVASGQLVCESKGDTNKILDVQWNKTKLANPNQEFVTVGEKHIKFWQIVNGKLQAQAGVLGDGGERQTFLTVGFTPEATVIGTKSGEIYVFKGTTINPKQSFNAHSAMVYSVFVDIAGNRLYTGGKDGVVNIWSASDFKKQKTIDFNKFAARNAVRAIHCLPNSNKLVVGTLASSIYTVDIRTGEVKPQVQAHYGDLANTDGDNYGELWGLSPHPSKAQFATVCEDKTLRIWNVSDRKLVLQVDIQQNALCCAFSPDAKHIAVGCTDGCFAVFDATTGTEELRKRAGRRRVCSIKYSPDGKHLAVGTADNDVKIYDVADEYKLHGSGKGASSVILHVDWAEDSAHLQTTSQAYELLHFDATGKFIEAASSLRDTKWATQECTLGWNVQGIWPLESDGSDVNTVNKSHSGKYLASAEDSGLVKVFNYPCVGSHLSKEGNLTKRPMSVRAAGHSSHVTNVNWTFDDSHVISTGGADMCVMQWKVTH